MLAVIRYLTVKENLYKVARLCRDQREFLYERLNMFRERRCLNLCLNTLEVKRIPRHYMWITRCFNELNIAIHTKMDILYFAKLMKHFHANVKLNLSMYNVHDE